MIKLYSEPGRVVQKRTFAQGKPRIAVLFQFDENGEYEIDDTKLSETDLTRLLENFSTKRTVIPETKEVVKEVKAEGLKVQLEDVPYSELKTMAKNLGINTYGMKRPEIEEAIKGVR